MHERSNPQQDRDLVMVHGPMMVVAVASILAMVVMLVSSTDQGFL